MRSAWRLESVMALRRRSNVAMVAAWLLFSPFVHGDEANQPARVSALQCVGFTVSDLDRSIAFFEEVLQFEKISEVELVGDDVDHLQGVFGVRRRSARLQLGKEIVELSEYLVPRGRPVPQDSRSHDRWFQHIAIITGDMERAYAHLREHRVRHASTGPQRLPDWNKNAGGIKAFYFHDPDDHVLEVLQFPVGKGDPKWHQPSTKLFLGIDHTAIVVADTEASLKFYRDTLGFKVAGKSENHGTEQEHLNHVFGARLRITALKTANGPAIEFLEYLSPSDGRDYPRDAKPHDLLHWETTLQVPDAQAAALAMQSQGMVWVSSGVVPSADRRLGFKKGFLIRDPDGHAIRIVEP